MNSIFEVKMRDEQVLKMTLNFKNLYLLRNIDKKTYAEYMRISAEGARNEIEFAQILYTAYKCANLEDVENCMSFLEFLDILPLNREKLIEILDTLQGKKNTNSQKNLKEKRKK